MAQKPVLHRRDHEHGGADPVRITYDTIGGGGAAGLVIRFDTDPQEGGFLKIETTEFIEITDHGGAGIFIDAAVGGPLSLHANENVQIRGEQGVEISGVNGLELAGHPVTFNLVSGDNIVILNLPTSPPAAANCLWRDSSGFLRIT